MSFFKGPAARRAQRLEEAARIDREAEDHLAAISDTLPGCDHYFEVNGTRPTGDGGTRVDMKCKRCDAESHTDYYM